MVNRYVSVWNEPNCAYHREVARAIRCASRRCSLATTPSACTTSTRCITRRRATSTSELMLLHVSEETRRGAPMVPEVLDRLRRTQGAHDRLPRPPQGGAASAWRPRPRHGSARSPSPSGGLAGVWPLKLVDAEEK